MVVDSATPMHCQELNDARVISFAKADTVAFVCECSETCRRSVMLSPRAFISMREAGEPIVYEGHVPAADEPTAGEREESKKPQRSTR